MKRVLAIFDVEDESFEYGVFDLMDARLRSEGIYLDRAIEVPKTTSLEEIRQGIVDKVSDAIMED